jgi:uncharacterized protein YbaR (Trm112 family)
MSKPKKAILIDYTSLVDIIICPTCKKEIGIFGTYNKKEVKKCIYCGEVLQGYKLCYLEEKDE